MTLLRLEISAIRHPRIASRDGEMAGGPVCRRIGLGRCGRERMPATRSRELSKLILPSAGEIPEERRLRGRFAE